MHSETFVNELPIHFEFMLQRARRLCRNDADARDLVQDTCLNALEAQRKSAARPDNLRAWLTVIMRNHWFSSMRQHRLRSHAYAEVASRSSLDDGLCQTRLVCSQLSSAWMKLAPQSRTIARQCLLEGDSQEDVSRRLGMTAGGVAASIHRTRAALWQTMFGATS